MGDTLGGRRPMKEMLEEYGGVIIGVALMAVILRVLPLLCSVYRGAAGLFSQSLGNCL
mgnify:CR=1 FL=1